MKKLKNLKDGVRDAEGLSQAQFDLLKSLFTNKISIAQAQNAINEGEAIFIQN